MCKWKRIMEDWNHKPQIRITRAGAGDWRRSNQLGLRLDSVPSEYFSNRLVQTVTYDGRQILWWSYKAVNVKSFASFKKSTRLFKPALLNVPWKQQVLDSKTN